MLNGTFLYTITFFLHSSIKGNQTFQAATHTLGPSHRGVMSLCTNHKKICRCRYPSTVWWFLEKTMLLKIILQMAQMARFTFTFTRLKVHFHAGCKNNTAMHCFGPLVMLIGLPVSDMGQKMWLSNGRNDRTNIPLHRAHSNNLEPVNPYESQDPKWAKIGLFEKFQNYHVKDSPWITTISKTCIWGEIPL